MAAYTAKCHAPGCTNVGNHARGFCIAHYREFKKACVENGSWSNKDDRAEMQERMQSRVIEPKWEYEPTPEQDAELSEKYGGTKQ
jgi:hypothetical protein